MACMPTILDHPNAGLESPLLLWSPMQVIKSPGFKGSTFLADFRPFSGENFGNIREIFAAQY